MERFATGFDVVKHSYLEYPLDYFSLTFYLNSRFSNICTTKTTFAPKKAKNNTKTIVRTTGVAGGLLHPYKGLIPACARKAH